MQYSLGITGDAALAHLTRWAAAPLGLQFNDHAPQFHIHVERHAFPEECLAAIVVRSASGQIASYPATRVRRTPGGVETVTAVPSCDGRDELLQQAITWAAERKVVGALTMTRTAEGAVETHLGPDEAGLWSLDAAHTSVFHNHVRAVLDLPLGSPAPLVPVAVTVTAVAGTEEDPTGALQHVHARDREARVHLYDAAVESGAPLGHVTCFGHDVDDLRRRAHHAANYLMGVDDR